MLYGTSFVIPSRKDLIRRRSDKKGRHKNHTQTLPPRIGGGAAYEGMRKLPYDPWSCGLVPQSNLIGPNATAKKRSAERRQRKQHAVDQLFKTGTVTYRTAGR